MANSSTNGSFNFLQGSNIPAKDHNLSTFDTNNIDGKRAGDSSLPHITFVLLLVCKIDLIGKAARASCSHGERSCVNLCIHPNMLLSLSLVLYGMIL